MNTLLIFFAFPIAVIIISAVLQKLLVNPITVAALIFAVFLVITFAFFDESFLIATLSYTIIAFITSFIVSFLCSGNENDQDDSDDNCTNTTDTTQTLTSTLNSDANNNYGYRYSRYRRY